LVQDGGLENGITSEHGLNIDQPVIKLEEGESFSDESYVVDMNLETELVPKSAEPMKEKLEQLEAKEK
jgi:hypothetical protein